MKNKITELFEQISDDDLELAIVQIKESQKTGIIPENGLVRIYTKKVMEITKSNNISAELFITESLLLREAAYRWLEIKVKHNMENK